MTDLQSLPSSVHAMPVAGVNNAADRTSTGVGRTWPWALAAMAGLGLVLALGLVVQNVVRQADLRHADTAARSHALWRCNGLPRRDAREACRREATTVTAGTVR